MGDGNDEVGDRRKKHVSVDTGEGERVEHGDVYLRFSETEFAVSEDPTFPEDETVRYEKAAVKRVEVTQHHSACFITTATADRPETLEALRGFRDDALAESIVGRGMIGSYEAVSPPIARTLARHPGGRTTRAVSWIVERCASLARRRGAATSAVERRLLSAALTGAYTVGLSVAMAGHAFIRARESIRGRCPGQVADRQPRNLAQRRRASDDRD